MPPVKPKTHARPILHSVFGPSLTWCLTLWRLFQNCEPPWPELGKRSFASRYYALIILAQMAFVSLINFPNPFKEEGSIHFPCISQAKTSHIFRSTDHMTIHHVIPTLQSWSFPKESGPKRVKLCVDSFMKKEETHREDRQVVKASIGKD
jgi:hypothetical protein